MLQLTTLERALLKGIVEAGGLRQLSDIVRLSIAPAQVEDEARWQRYLSLQGDGILMLAKQICGPDDLVLFDGRLVTVMLHPVPKRDADALRMELIARLTDRLAGIPEIPVSRLLLQHDPPSNLLHWISAVGQAASQAAASDVSPNPIGAAKVVAAHDVTSTPNTECAPVQADQRVSADPYEGLDLIEDTSFELQSVVRHHGTMGAFVRLNLPMLGQDSRRYFEPDESLAMCDVRAIQEAGRLAFRQLREKRQKPTPIMFPLNINNLRKSEFRHRILFELRQTPRPVCALMEPVFVRCIPGMPQSALLEVTGYLNAYFSRMWVFASGLSDPKRYRWPETRVGVIVDGLTSLNGVKRIASVQAWRTMAGKQRCPLAVLSTPIEAVGGNDFSVVTDSIVAMM